jgi:UTP--glucose-1-phosphate uridylyltransferase
VSTQKFVPSLLPLILLAILSSPDLTISGNVTIGRNVTLKGTVIIIAVEGSSIHIPDGSILENKLCSGNFSIIDH